MRKTNNENESIMIVHIPGAEHLVLVYNKFQELDLTLYSRCIVCRMDEDGEFESLEYEDGSLFMHYLSM